MSTHLTKEEARAVLVLSATPEWKKYIGYLARLWSYSTKQCRTEREDHRFFQGENFRLTELARIEEKAKNILDGE